MRYAIYVHDPEGDSGEGAIVGAFKDDDRAARHADRIMNASEHRLEAIVVRMFSGSDSARSIVEFVDRFAPTPWFNE